MSTDITLQPPNTNPTEHLVERISDLEQELRNARRLHLTIERNTRLFEALLASSEDGIALTRLDGTLIRIIRSVAGWGSTEMAGRSVFDLLHPEDIETMRECYRQINGKMAQKVLHEVRLLRRDGSSIWVAGTVTDMLDDPAVQAIVHNYRDITERKAGELAAAELAAVVQQAPFAMFSKSVAGQILTWNQGAKEMFGYSQSEIVGCSVNLLIPPELQLEEVEQRALVIATRTSSPRIRTMRLRKGGLRIAIELVLCPLITPQRVEGVAHLSYPVADASVHPVGRI